MSSSTLPFDPKRVGPVDAVKIGLGRLRAVWRANQAILIAAAVSLVALAWYLGVSWPGLPNWLVIVILVGSFAALLGAPWGYIVAANILRPDTRLVSEVNAPTGDQRLYHLSPERFDDMRVYSQTGKPRDRSYLKNPEINGRQAWEVDLYDPESNVAVASWMAGRSNIDVRRSERTLYKIKSDLERQTDKALELLINHPDILRESLGEAANELVRVAEDVELPEGKALHKRLGEALEEADRSHELLMDGEEDDEPAAIAGRSSDGDVEGLAALPGDVRERLERSGVTFNGETDDVDEEGADE